MLRISMLAPMVFGFTTSVAVCAEDARQLTCEGSMIEPAAMSRSPKTVKLTLGRAHKVTLDLGQGVISARVLSNKKSAEVQNQEFRGGVFSLHGRFVLHLQIRPPHAADVQSRVKAGLRTYGQADAPHLPPHRPRLRDRQGPA